MGLENITNRLSKYKDLILVPIVALFPTLSPAQNVPYNPKAVIVDESSRVALEKYQKRNEGAKALLAIKYELCPLLYRHQDIDAAAKVADQFRIKGPDGKFLGPETAAKVYNGNLEGYVCEYVLLPGGM